MIRLSYRHNTASEGRRGVTTIFWIYVALGICLLLFGSFFFSPIMSRTIPIQLDLSAGR